MESFIDSTFKFLDKEKDIELEILKLISEQDRAKWPEIPSYDEIDQEISKLIQEFQEEERKQKDLGKPSISSCASPLMSFLSDVNDKELASASRDIKLGCPDIEKCIDKKDSNSQELNRDNLDNDRDKLEIVPSNQYCGQANKSDQFAQLQDPSHNVTQGKTEGVLLPLLKLHISPTSKIVHRLLQLKRKRLKGPSRRHMQDPKDLTADLLLLSSLSVTASLSSKLLSACVPVCLESP